MARPSVARKDVRGSGQSRRMGQARAPVGVSARVSVGVLVAALAVFFGAMPIPAQALAEAGPVPAVASSVASAVPARVNCARPPYL